MSFKKISEGWPFIIAGLACICRIDLVVPVLRSFGVRGIVLFLLSGSILTLTFAVWYWFWGVISQNLDKMVAIKDDFNFGKEIVAEVKEHGIWDQIKDYFVNKYKWIRGPDNPRVKRFKARGYKVMFFFGLNPYGTRTLSIAFCRVIKSKKAFFALYTGAMVYVVIITLFWHHIFYFFTN